MKPEEVDAPQTIAGLDRLLYVVALIPIERDTHSEVAVKLRTEPTDGDPQATLFVRPSQAHRFTVGSRV